MSTLRGLYHDAELSYKEDWTPEQRAEADAKCKALSDADTVKTKVERNDSPSVEYKKAFGKDSIPAGKDIDHTIDLQLGGNPDVKVNGKPLDKSVNRSLGKQITDSAFVASLTVERNYGFNTAVGSSYRMGTNTIAACISENQTIEQGGRVRLRLLQPLQAGNITVPANSLVTAV